MSWDIKTGHVLDVLAALEPESVQTCVTSPPYWGLRDYGDGGQEWPEVEFAPMPGLPPLDIPGQTVPLGLEPDPWAYVGHLVEVFRAVRRVLRADGTLWLNLGDSFQDKQLQGMPWRVAYALQADGWYLRSDIIWHKPNPMPESITDRPTKAHEYLFLMSKSARYYYDADAIKEPASTGDARKPYGSDGAWNLDGRDKANQGGGTERTTDASMRNVRSVFSFPTRPYPGAHFAVFPPELPERCIKAGTSERGACSTCGAPLGRELERVSTGQRYSVGKSKAKNEAGLATGFSGYDDGSSSPVFKTIGWRPGCACGTGRVPCIVLDPFSGAGTTGMVARRLQRSYIGAEQSEAYAEMSRRRIEGDAPLFNRDTG